MSYLRTLQARRGRAQFTGFEFNLQLFAEGGEARRTEDGADPQSQEEGDQGADEQDDDADPGRDDAGRDKPAKTFTQTDIDRIMNAKYRKWQADLEARLDAAKNEGRTEAEKLAKMSERQRAEHERTLVDQQMQRRESEIKKREAEVVRRELQATAQEALQQKGMPKGLSGVLNYENADTCNASIAAVEAAFREAVQEAVDERLRSAGVPLRGGKTPDFESMTDDEYYRHRCKT